MDATIATIAREPLTYTASGAVRPASLNRETYASLMGVIPALPQFTLNDIQNGHPGKARPRKICDLMQCFQIFSQATFNEITIAIESLSLYVT